MGIFYQGVFERTTHGNIPRKEQILFVNTSAEVLNPFKGKFLNFMCLRSGDSRIVKVAVPT